VTTITVSEKRNLTALTRTRTMIFCHNDIWRREQKYFHESVFNFLTLLEIWQCFLKTTAKGLLAPSCCTLLRAEESMEAYTLDSTWRKVHISNSLRSCPIHEKVKHICQQNPAMK
jgi:hypothetical protein